MAHNVTNATVVNMSLTDVFLTDRRFKSHVYYLLAVSGSEHAKRYWQCR